MSNHKKLIFTIATAETLDKSCQIFVEALVVSIRVLLKVT